jgi:hypothetical protein
VGVSGLNYQMFVPPDTPVPFITGKRVYSCTLINHAMPHRWRLELNDDTDLCLQALSDGWPTLLVNAYMANKIQTMKIPGGNTPRYTGGGRLEMARTLAAAWPGIVEVRWKFGRPQHVVKWDAFDVPLILGPPRPVPIYDLQLIEVGDVRNPELRQLLAEDQPPHAVARP